MLMGGCLLLGLGIGFFIDNVVGGALVGLGAGMIAEFFRR